MPAAGLAGRQSGGGRDSVELPQSGQSIRHAGGPSAHAGGLAGWHASLTDWHAVCALSGKACRSSSQGCRIVGLRGLAGRPGSWLATSSPWAATPLIGLAWHAGLHRPAQAFLIVPAGCSTASPFSRLSLLLQKRSFCSSGTATCAGIARIPISLRDDRLPHPCLPCPCSCQPRPRPACP